MQEQVTATRQLYEKYGFSESIFFHALLAEIPENESRKMVGFALYFFTFSTFTGKPTLYLEDLFVIPEFRGQGIGKRFLKELAQIAIQQDCGRMEWSVLNWNRHAIEFYQSMGANPLPDWTLFRLNRSEIKKLSEI